MEDAVKTVFKEIQQIQRKSVFDDKATIEFYNEENPLELKINLTPSDGLYSGAKIEFKMKIPPNYPHSRPSFECKTKVYHPNINLQGSICFSMLSESQIFNIEQYVNGLLWLIYNPNISSRLNSNVTTDQSQFETNAKSSIRGAVINGVNYPRIMTRELTVPEVIYMLFNHQLNKKEKPNLKMFTISDLFEASKNEPILKKDEIMFALKEIDQKSEIHFCRSNTVAKRSKFLEVREQIVCKEMILNINGESCMILTNGRSNLDLEIISKSLEIPQENLNLPKAKEVKKTFPISTITIFDKALFPKLYVNSDIFELETVFTSLGNDLLIQINTKDILIIRPDAIVLSCTTKK